MNQIQLDRSKYYHLLQDINLYCQHEFGPGCYGIARDEYMWGYEVTFGYPTFYFMKNEDYVRFLFKWSCL